MGVGTARIREIGGRRGIRLDLIADAAGILQRSLLTSVIGSFVRCEAQMSGGATWTLKLLGEGGHDLFEGKLAGLAQGVPVSVDLTLPVGGGSLGHVPLIIVADACALLDFAGGASAAGYVELWQ